MKLKNEHLQITFTDPAAMDSPRFDHAGFITEVLLDDTYQFCMPEQMIPGRRNSHGMGLCGEFILGTGELAQEGEWFYKPGVGLVKQTEDFKKFDIFGTYEVQSYPVTTEQPSDQCITFSQKGIPWNGYAADLQKTYSLQDNQLILDIQVTNTGTEKFELSEYQHNFVSLDQISAGPGYVLELPCDGNIQALSDATLRWGDEAKMPSIVSVQETAVHWTDRADNRVLYHESYDMKSDAPYCWKLSHKQSPLSVTEEVDFCPSMIIVWSVEHCICAELYHAVKLAPGEKAQWRRKWTFER